MNGKRKAQNRVRGECLEGGELRMFVNSEFVTEVTDPEPLPVGTTWGFEPVTFDSKTLVVEFDDFELVDLT